MAYCDYEGCCECCDGCEAFCDWWFDYIFWVEDWGGRWSEGNLWDFKSNLKESEEKVVWRQLGRSLVRAREVWYGWAEEEACSFGIQLVC
jgi:hypothetical protein